MTANGGVVRAQLILDSSQFSKGWKTAVNDIQNSTQGLGNATKELQNIESQLGNVGNTASGLRSKFMDAFPLEYISQVRKQVAEAEGSFAAAGRSLEPAVTQAKNFGSAMSSIWPGDVMGRGLNQFMNTFNSTVPTAINYAKQLRSQFASISSAAQLAGKNAAGAIPLEDIWAADSAANALNKTVLETAGSFAASSRSFVPATATMTSGWGRVRSAVNSAGTAVQGITSKISQAANETSIWTAGMVAAVGVMAGSAIYNSTVGTANTYQGMVKYWNTVYGSGVANQYQAAVANMAMEHYQPYSVSAKSLQLLVNTMPIGTDASSVTSLLPVVAAYRNFYKAMKPDQAALADIEAPQDIAAVFSGNTGEIRASPLASQLKQIASLPQADKMQALLELFNNNGVMNYLDGITDYDKEMNKLNTTLNDLEITVGTGLLPTATNLLGMLNGALKTLGGNAKYLVYLAGAIAGLATLGGVGVLVAKGVNDVIGGLSKVKDALSWFGRVTGLTDKIKSALSPVADAAGNALSSVKAKVVDALSPVTDAAGNAVSGVKDAVKGKLNSLKKWIQTEWNPNPTGEGGTGSSVIKGLAITAAVVYLTAAAIDAGGTGREVYGETGSPGAGILAGIEKFEENMPLGQIIKNIGGFSSPITGASALSDWKTVSSIGSYLPIGKGIESISSIGNWESVASGLGKLPISKGIESLGSMDNWKGVVSGLEKLPISKGIESITSSIMHPGSLMKGILPGTSSAAGTGGNKGIMNDITGKNGLLDFSRFIPKFTWPKVSLSNIKQWVMEKVSGVLGLPGNLTWSSLKAWVLQKVLGVLGLPGNLSWGSLKAWVLQKVLGVLGLPGNLSWGSIKSWVMQKVLGILGLPGNLSWDSVKSWVTSHILGYLSFPTITWNQVAGWIINAIGHFSWPSGPGGIVTGWVHNAESNFAAAMAQRAQSQAQSAANAQSYSQSSSFQTHLNQRWGGVLGGQGPAGPSGSRMFDNIFGRFRYEDYSGSQKGILQTLDDGSGNCFDVSMAEMYLAGLLGMPSKLIWSTWNGGSHVYPEIGGLGTKDAANHALSGSWGAPPKGPGDSSPVQLTINVHLDDAQITGVDDLNTVIEKASEKGAIKVLNKYFR